jgi:glycosyltransferase involved in cell wall biosynthesis
VVAPLDAWAIAVRTEAAGARGAAALWRRAQGWAVDRYVASAYRPFARVILVTDEDAAATVAADPTLRTAVIPNGVDAAHFRPDPQARRDHRTLLFTGILGTPANEHAALRLAHRVLPRVREAMPDARLVLAGRAPSRRVAALASRPGVSIVRDVPDLRPLLAGAGVYACPMESGTGIKNKLLEAMACGAAAVATPLACQGMRVRDGEQLVIAGSDDAFASAVSAILGDALLRERLGMSARRYVEAHHDWDAVARAYEAVYAEASAGGPALAAV